MSSDRHRRRRDAESGTDTAHLAALLFAVPAGGWGLGMGPPRCRAHRRHAPCRAGDGARRAASRARARRRARAARRDRAARRRPDRRRGLRLGRPHERERRRASFGGGCAARRGAWRRSAGRRPTHSAAPTWSRRRRRRKGCWRRSRTARDGCCSRLRRARDGSCPTRSPRTSSRSTGRSSSSRRTGRRPTSSCSMSRVRGACASPHVARRRPRGLDRARDDPRGPRRRHRRARRGGAQRPRRRRERGRGRPGGEAVDSTAGGHLLPHGLRPPGRLRRHVPRRHRADRARGAGDRRHARDPADRRPAGRARPLEHAAVHARRGSPRGRRPRGRRRAAAAGAPRTRTGRLFVGPDNGLLLPAAERAGIVEARELANPAYALESISRTFHGRDLFAPAAAHLANGVPLAELGPPARSRTRSSASTSRCRRSATTGSTRRCSTSTASATSRST